LLCSNVEYSCKRVGLVAVSEKIVLLDIAETRSLRTTYSKKYSSISCNGCITKCLSIRASRSTSATNSLLSRRNK
jgi:hypothetical protein